MRQGGECPLQDQTLAYGPGESRFVEEKRHFEKPIAISDLVLLDRERCIQCGRCTRFAEEIAGEALIDFAGRGERVEVATFPDEPFSSYFSGNTIQICPVGALTATAYRFTARPWDLDQVESTCTTCALGCRAAVQSSANRLTRLLGIDSDPVNQGWLCDKGRFAYEAVNGDEVDAGPLPPAAAGPDVDVAPATAAQVVTLGPTRGQYQGEVREAGRLEHGRLTEPLVRRGGDLVPAGWGEALAVTAAALGAAREAGGPGAVAVLGGARLTNEDAYAWARLAKGVIGTDSVDAQLGDGLPAELVLALPRATIDEACTARVTVVLGGDLREELPVLFLRLRQAALEGATSLIELAPHATALTRYASVSLPIRPGDSPELARALTGDDGSARGLAAHPEGPAWPADRLERARSLVATDDGAPEGTGVVVVLGRPSVAEHADVTAEAARVLAAAWPGARFLPALRRGNVFGALDMGLAPGMLPGRTTLDAGRSRFAAAWGSVPATPGRDATGVLGALAGSGDEGSDRPRVLVLLGSDPLTDYPDQAAAEAALGAADFVLAVTGHPSASSTRADVVLPVAVAHERGGSTTNIEGRVTRLGQKLVAPGLAWPDWMIATELAAALGADLGFTSLNDIRDEIARLAPSHAGLDATLLERPDAADGIVVPLGPAPGRRRVEPIDPIALPGVESVERQGAPPRVGLAEPAGAEEGDGHHDGHAGPSGAVPAVLGPADVGRPGTLPAISMPDSYSLRLVSTRRLYDGGSAVTGSPSLTPLVPTPTARANPYDLDRLGVGTGDPVRIRARRGNLVLPAQSDPGVPRGVLAIDFNVPGADGPANAAATVIDATAPVNEVRIESV